VTVLVLEGLRKRYGEVTALDVCSFGVRPGQMVGFLGPNGAGKTTAMRSVFGLVGLDGGSITWEGRPLDRETWLGFGYMPEERGLYPRMRVLEQVTYFGRLHGMGRSEASVAAGGLLEAFGLADRADVRLQDLSHGNQQRVQLAVAVVHQPRVLVLDEPFSGLDPVAAETMAAILRDQAAGGAAVLFSSHQLDVVEHLCEDVVIINEGRVVLSGRVDELRAASPHRYVDVLLDGGGTRWADAVPGAQVVMRNADRVRLMVDRGADPAELVARAREAGEIVEFAFVPPRLSEVFREAVTR
jgi:ABC-2 type transport system ATP-binding protein